MCDGAKIVLLVGLCLMVMTGQVVEAQQAPDTILFNGKIVTLDDHSFTSELGTIVQAMSIKDGKIVSIGTNSEVRGEAGPNTRLIDLGGRTVTPGFISVHEHPYDWAGVNPRILPKVLNDDMVVTRFLKGSPEEQLKEFPGVLEAAVQKARPGQWVYIIFLLGDQYQYATRGNADYPRQFGMRNIEAVNGKHFTKELLDRLAPNNPVLVRDTFVGMILNEKALDEVAKVFPMADTNLISRETGMGGRDGGANFRSVLPEVVMKGRYKELREIHRLELSWWAGFGMTAFGSLAYTPSHIAVYKDLADSGELPNRSMWMWNWREDVLFEDQYVLNTSVFMEGKGTDVFWYGGAQGSVENGRDCSVLEPRVELTAAERACAFSPGRAPRETLFRYIKSGGRFVGNHTVGDKDIDNILEIITTASEEAGFTLEQVRAKRHTYDHLVMSPRPDQVPRIKELGMVLGGDAFELYQTPPSVLAIYGERALDWMVPKKRLMDAGIPSGFEIDRAISGTDLTMFWNLARFIDRKAWDGKVYGQDQKIGRELALKSATYWGAYYLIKEDVLGSLEPGKYADFMVLDRDYLTVPEQEIEDIKVLMTMMGGEVQHLMPVMAQEIGMEPIGAMVELTEMSQAGETDGTQVRLAEAYAAPDTELAIPVYLTAEEGSQVGSLDLELFF